MKNFNLAAALPQPEDPLITTGKKVLAREGKAIADLIGRPLSSTQGISFAVNYDDEKGVAHCIGKEITLFKKYFAPRAYDFEGAVVHELTHAIQRGAKYDKTFGWMVEGIADFVRYKLGYGLVRDGDPELSYGHAAGFVNWLYERPNDNHKTYYDFVKNVTDGVLPKNIDGLLAEYTSRAEYNCGAIKSNFSGVAKEHRQANENTVKRPSNKPPSL